MPLPGAVPSMTITSSGGGFGPFLPSLTMELVMKIYCVTEPLSESFLPDRASAMAHAKFCVDLLKERMDEGAVYVVEYTVRKMDKEGVCAILNSQGGCFATDSNLIREWKVKLGSVFYEYGVI